MQPVKQQVRRRDDRDDEPEDEPGHEQRDDHDEGEDRQRWTDQEPEEHEGGHLDGAERLGGGDARERRVGLERLGG